MIELDFLVPAQVHAGVGAFGSGSPVDVEISPSPTIFPDHEQFVHVKLTTDPPAGTRTRVVRAHAERVPRNEAAINDWIEHHARIVGRVLDREIQRRQKLMRQS